MDYTEKTALIVVDVQNDFADPEGSLYVSGGEETVPFINAQIEAARADGATIVRTADWHPESTPHFEKDGGIWPVHCVAGSWGAEFHPDLLDEGPVVRSGTGNDDGYSAFTGRDLVTGEERPTELEPLLRDEGITDVAVVGLATDYCVLQTVIDAAKLGFATTLLADGVRGVNLDPGDSARAIAEMVACGVTVE